MDEVRIEAKDEVGNLYAPFYCYGEGHKEFVKHLNAKVLEKLNELGIKEEKAKATKKKGRK